MVVSGHLGTGFRCRGPGRRGGESSARVVPGQGAANLDETDPQAMSELGDWRWQSIDVRSDRGAGPPLIGKLRDVLTDVGVELPGAAIHGGLLHCRELRMNRGASPGGVIGS